MKRLFAAGIAMALLAALPIENAGAQRAGPAALAQQRAAIDAFDWMDGTWRGPAVTRGPGGEHKVIQTERIGDLLGGTIKVVEGKGFNPDGSVGFNAFGVISWDAAAQAYTFRSYAQGQAGSFVITPNAAGRGYVWQIPAGPATIRYTATLENGIWHEVGDRIMPGAAPVRFFDMRLTRVGDTDWPAAGGLKAK